MLRPGIEPRSPRPLANTLPTRPMSPIFTQIYIYVYHKNIEFLISNIFFSDQILIKNFFGTALNVGYIQYYSYT